jgi:hypothetical protein
MLAARVEQKNGMTKEDKNGVIPIDKESPIQAPYKPYGAQAQKSCARRTFLD